MLICREACVTSESRSDRLPDLTAASTLAGCTSSHADEGGECDEDEPVIRLMVAGLVHLSC